MRKFWVIVKEVYKKNVKSLGFITMILSPIILLAIIGVIVYLIANTDIFSQDDTIAIISDDEAVRSALIETDFTAEKDTSIVTEEAAREALAAEEIVGYIVASEENNTLSAEFVHTSRNNAQGVALLSSQLTTYQNAIRGSALGLSGEEMSQLFEPARVSESVVRVEDGEIIDQDMTEYAIKLGSAYAVGIGIFIFIMTYAGIIAEEVASEKGTRIMEVILSSVSSTTHFFGKLVGVLFICFTQIGLYIILGTIGYQVFKDAEFVQQYIGGIDIGEILQSLLGYTLIFFVIGVFMYVVLAAFFGSLVTKIEDVNKAVTPIVFIAMIGFYGGLFAFGAPDQPLVLILSYIPLFTPFIMPFRIAAETVTQSGIWISIVASGIFAVLLTFISMILYRSNVLIYSDANFFQTLKRSWKILKSNQKANG